MAIPIWACISSHYRVPSIAQHARQGGPLVDMVAVPLAKAALLVIFLQST